MTNKTRHYSQKALGAVVALITVQVSLGLLFRLSQSHGHYDFSQAASLAITECLKLVISFVLYWREVNSRHCLPTSHLPMISDDISRNNEKTESNQEVVYRLEDQSLVAQNPDAPVPSDRSLKAVIQCWRKEADRPVLLGFGGLAVAYFVNNNVVRRLMNDESHLTSPRAGLLGLPNGRSRHYSTRQVG